MTLVMLFLYDSNATFSLHKVAQKHAYDTEVHSRSQLIGMPFPEDLGLADRGMGAA